MLLWSIVPQDIVFDYSREGKQDNMQYLNYNGMPLQVRFDGSGYGRIQRIFSTDPADYLKKELSPGMEIHF